MSPEEADRRQQAYARPNIMPDKMVTWYDLAKGAGEAALEFLVKRHVTEPHPFTTVTPTNVDRLLPPSK